MRYSKFTHGCAVVFANRVNTKPSWVEEFLPKIKGEKKKKKESPQFGGDPRLVNPDVWIDPNQASVYDSNELNNLSDPSLKKGATGQRLNSAARNDVERVLSERESKRPSFFTKLCNLFNFDQRFVKEGRPIVGKQSIFFFGVSVIH